MKVALFKSQYCQSIDRCRKEEGGQQWKVEEVGGGGKWKV
ncbi:hypothetical protein A2U01_0082657, partial [Trifolium medium]|nr:hypothetical protein [Trifolium medium]